MKTEIREWNKDDIQKIADLEKKSFENAWNEKMLLEEWGNPLFKCFVYDIDGVLAGYVGFHVVGTEIYVANIAVYEEYKRRKIALMLLEAVEKYGKENGAFGMTLEVNEENKIAIALYTKMGFETQGRRKKYYNTQDALIMWKYF